MRSGYERIDQMKKTVVECDLCDRSQEIEMTEEPGFFICKECWEDLKLSIQKPILSNRTRANR